MSFTNFHASVSSFFLPRAYAVHELFLYLCKTKEKQKNGAMEKGHIHPRGYWTLERVIEESQKYQKKGDFKRHSPSAYAIACRKGLISSMIWLKDDLHKKRGPRKVHKYTKEKNRRNSKTPQLHNLYRFKESQ